MRDNSLDQLVDQMARRMCWVAGWQAFGVWITGGLALIFLTLLTAVWSYAYWPAGAAFLEITAAIALILLLLALTASGLAGAAAHRAHPVREDRLLASQELDRRLGLQDRLTSALQLRDLGTPFVHALLQDARRRQPDGLEDGLYPLTLPPIASLSGVLGLCSVLILSALGLALGGDAPQDGATTPAVVDDATRETIEQVARQLKHKADQISASQGAASRQQKRPISGALRKVARKLHRPGVSRKQALQQVSQGRSALRKIRQAKQAERKQLSKDIAALATELRKDRLTQQIGQQLAQGKLKQASQGLGNLAQRISKQRLLDAEKKRLKKRLTAAKKRLKSKSSSALADQLQKAARALGSGRDGAAGEAMSKLAAKLLRVENLLSSLDELDRLANEAQMQLDWAKVKLSRRDKYGRQQQDSGNKYRNQRRGGNKPVKINPNQVRIGSGGKQGRGGGGPADGPCIGCKHKARCAECPCRTVDKDCPVCKAKCACPRCWVNISFDRKSRSRSRGAGSLSMGRPRAGMGHTKRTGKGGRIKSKRNPSKLKSHRVGREGESQIQLIRGANDRSKSGLDYRNMIERFRREAEDRIIKERVPLGRREYIKQYFQRIKPR